MYLSSNFGGKMSVMQICITGYKRRERDARIDLAVRFFLSFVSHTRLEQHSDGIDCTVSDHEREKDGRR
jgi:hypothetical protein